MEAIINDTLGNNSPATQQRTDEWFEQRRGKFTASEIHKLLVKDRAGKDFGKVAKDYIFEKIAELLGAEKEEIFSKSTEWGNEFEPIARQELANYLGVEIQESGFVQYCNFSGASPDGLIDELHVVEIKCPYNAKNHLENLFLIETQKDFEKLRWEYYCQIQWQMECTGRTRGYFYSYHPKFKAKCLEVVIDTELIADIKDAIRKAKTEYIIPYLKRYKAL